MVHKIGMFGVAGDQVRGTGFLHDGSVETLNSFLEAPVFTLTNQEESDLEAFMLAFPTDLAPIVGQQVTIGPSSFAVTDVKSRISLIDTRAGTTFESKVLGGVVTECDVVVKTVEGGVEKGYFSASGGNYTPDDGGMVITEAVLRAKADPGGAAQTLTYTAVPPGSGERVGVDRDEDDVYNGLDNCPAAPNGPAGGTCTAGDPGLIATECANNGDCGGGGFCSKAQEDADVDQIGDACDPDVVPEPSAFLLLTTGCLWLAGLGHRSRS